MTKQAVIRHLNEPDQWCSDLAAALELQAFATSVVTDTARLKTYDKAWLWLCQALSIDCDVLLHIDCDCIVKGDLCLTALDTQVPTVLAGAAEGFSFAFSTGCMMLNRSARVLLLQYLQMHKPTFLVYDRYGKYRLGGDSESTEKLVAAVDLSFSRLCSELGITVVLDQSIVWRHRWAVNDYICAGLRPEVSIIANIRGQHGC